MLLDSVTVYEDVLGPCYCIQTCLDPTLSCTKTRSEPVTVVKTLFLLLHDVVAPVRLGEDWTLLLYVMQTLLHHRTVTIYSSTVWLCCTCETRRGLEAHSYTYVLHTAHQCFLALFSMSKDTKDA